jgi:isopenicillin N synthase-like dioxygenase
MDELQGQILKALALGFKLSEEYFLKFHLNSDHSLRMLHYPRYENLERYEWTNRIF